jgi:hypothetical protein
MNTPISPEHELPIQGGLRKRRNREMLGRLNEVYAAGPSPEERRTVVGMKRRFRSTIRESRRS